METAFRESPLIGWLIEGEVEEPKIILQSITIHLYFFQLNPIPIPYRAIGIQQCELPGLVTHALCGPRHQPQGHYPIVSTKSLGQQSP